MIDYASEPGAGQPSPFGYRPEIDGVRAVAVLAVIAHHFDARLLPGGFLGVDMFFVISGYVITGSLVGRPRDGLVSFLARFYTRRIKRLFPALIACVAVTSAAGALFIDAQTPIFSASIDAGRLSLFGLSNLYFFSKALDYFSISTRLNLFTHTWSLGVEEQFYALFPALFWLAAAPAVQRDRRHFPAILAVLSVASFSAGLWLHAAMANASYFLMPTRFWELGVGCLLALGPSRPSRFLPRLAVLLIAGAGLQPEERLAFSTPILVAGTALLILTVRAGSLLHRTLTFRPLLWVGLVSYSLYLWHGSVLSLGRWTIGVHLRTAPLLLATMFVLAAASYHWLERPLRRAVWAVSETRTIVYGLTAALCAAALVTVLRDGAGAWIYTGSRAYLAAKGPASLQNDKLLAGKRIWRATDCVITGPKDIGKPLTSEACTIDGADGGGRRFLVVGNSYSAAEFEMYSVLSEQDLGAVTATSAWGAGPVPGLLANYPWKDSAQYYWAKAVPNLIASLRPDDTLIMINDLAFLAPRVARPDDRAKLATLETELGRLAEDLRSKGIQIIFQSANPFIREATCSPDMAWPQWFNFGSETGCILYTQTETRQRMRPIQAVLERLAHAHANFHVLDLLPVLCPGEVCGFFGEHGVPLYRDEDGHPSVEGDYLLRPFFLDFVRKTSGASGVDRPPL